MGRHIGSFYRMDKEGVYTEIMDKICITNGPTWSLDGNTLYFVDTPTHEIFKYDYNQMTGSISNKTSFLKMNQYIGCL